LVEEKQKVDWLSTGRIEVGRNSETAKTYGCGLWSVRAQGVILPLIELQRYFGTSDLDQTFPSVSAATDRILTTHEGL
jgi:hypothetical protein